jgi:preprotein translocase subunit SecG
MLQIILIIHVLIAVSLIALVLLQHGKGADIGAAFGSGASQTIFGSRGSTSFLMKVTGLLAALFFATSIALTYFESRQPKSSSPILSQILPSSLNQGDSKLSKVPTQAPAK